MKTRMLGANGFQVSEVGLGCWQLGADWGSGVSREIGMEILTTVSSFATEITAAGAAAQAGSGAVADAGDGDGARSAGAAATPGPAPATAEPRAPAPAEAATDLSTS